MIDVANTRTQRHAETEAKHVLRPAGACSRVRG